MGSQALVPPPPPRLPSQWCLTTSSRSTLVCGQCLYTWILPLLKPDLSMAAAMSACCTFHLAYARRPLVTVMVSMTVVCCKQGTCLLVSLMDLLFQVAIQASGCSEMSAEELNHMLMGLTIGSNQLVGCWEFVAAAISPVKMLRGGCFLQVCVLIWNK